MKQKTPAAPASNNPDWNRTITLTPITDLEEDVRIQVYDRRMFAEDDQLGTVWKSKFYGALVLNHRVVLHAIDATPAR